MGKVIRFPGEWQGEDPEPSLLWGDASVDEVVEHVLQRRHERSCDESLLDDAEFKEMLARLERMEAEEDRLVEKIERETGKGMGVLFWVCLLLVIL